MMSSELRRLIDTDNPSLLRAYKGQFDSDAYYYAVAVESFDALKYMLRHGNVPPTILSELTFRSNKPESEYLEIIELLYLHGAQLDLGVCRFAAVRNFTRVINYVWDIAMAEAKVLTQRRGSRQV